MILAKLLFAFGLVFLFPAFVLQLAFDPVTFTFTSSVYLQLINAGVELFSIAMIFSSREATILLGKCKPMLFLIALVFANVLVSINPTTTLRAANVYLLVSMLGVAMATRLKQEECLGLIIQTMTLGCVLSIIWVLVYPDIAVHQSADRVQAVHAGLWRGIFSHKQGLGVFAGLTLGLLVFYGKMAFPLILRPIAIGCAVTCLIGTSSVTGMLTAMMTPALFIALRSIASLPPTARKVNFHILFASLAALYALFHFNVLNWIFELFGKSADMTGRAEFWPYILENFGHSRYAYLGSGLGAGFFQELSEWSVDNGFIDEIIEFGYVGSAGIFITYAMTLFAGRKIIIGTTRERAMIDIFPFGTMLLLLFINISESNFMGKHICTVLMAVVFIFITRAFVEQRKLKPERAAAAYMAAAAA
jgi:exopolysaccharide production protein ExoQ